MNRLIVIALFVWVAASEASVVPPDMPYVDPTQLDCPWPKHSDYKQLWRGLPADQTGRRIPRRHWSELGVAGERPTGGALARGGGIQGNAHRDRLGVWDYPR